MVKNEGDVQIGGLARIRFPIAVLFQNQQNAAIYGACLFIRISYRLWFNTPGTSFMMLGQSAAMAAV